MRVYQEIYCTTSGGGCGGYVVVSINMALNGVHRFVCPKCNHKHQRRIKDGVIMEDGRWERSPVDEICPTMAAWSEEPKSRIRKNETKKQ